MPFIIWAHFLARPKNSLFLLVGLLCCLCGKVGADPLEPTFVQGTALNATSPTQLCLPSQQPSGNATNDRIWLTFYPPSKGLNSSTPIPAVVLLHYLGAKSNKEMYAFGRYLAKNGVASAVVTLPYHGRRSSRGDRPINHFVAPNAKLVSQAFEQSSSDVSTVISWLCQQPGIDSQRIGAVGVSLGAIVTHLVMGRDARLKAGVAMLGGGDLLDIYRHSFLPSLFINGRLKNITPQDQALIRAVDPLTYADQNRPRRVLMIQAARDLFVPPRNGEKLWEALGKPPIQWLDVNHVGLELGQSSARKTALAFLQQAWAGQPLESIEVPTIRVPTIKAGVLLGLDSRVTPAIQWQAFKLGKRREHLPILNANLGMSGRGPFASVAATVNAFTDVGVARRFSGSRFRPYVSLHVVF